MRRPDVSPDSPAQAVGDDNRVVAVNALAAGNGIAVGMRRREAEAICPTVVTISTDPAAEMERFETAALAIENLVPRIEVVRPGLVFASVVGATNYYGGEMPLVEQVTKELDRVSGPGFRIGLAAGPFAARRAADLADDSTPVYVVEDDDSFRSSLDISSLGKEDLAATFRWLGITTLGELSRLPRDAIVSRFGTEGLSAHRLAQGEDRAPMVRDIPPDLAVESEFDPPLENLEQAAFITRTLSYRLMSALATEGAAPHRIVVEAEAADGNVRSRTWHSADPFNEETLAERVRWQLRAWLDHARSRSGPGIRGGVVRLRIAPADISDEGRQLALSEDAQSAAELQRSLARTQAILGDDRVLKAIPQGGRTPDERVAWYRWDEEAPLPTKDPKAPWPGRVPSPTPSLVPPEPTPLDVEWDEGMPVSIRLGSRHVPVLTWAGPWRSVGRWWEGKGPANRYQLVTSAGAFLCEMRDGCTYLTGVYD